MKKQKSKLNPDKISIAGIQIFKAKLDTTSDFVDTPQKPARFNIDIGEEMAYDFGNRKVRVRLHLNLNPMDDSQAIIAGMHAEYGIDFHFYIENMEELFQNGPNNEILIDVNLAATLFSMAYSTARGIVLERTYGTIMGGVILAVVDPYKLFSPPKV